MTFRYGFGRKKKAAHGLGDGRRKRGAQFNTVERPTQPTSVPFSDGDMTFLRRLAARVPLPLLHALGVVAGWMVYLGSPRYRRHLKQNLEGAKLDEPALRRAVIAEAG